MAEHDDTTNDAARAAVLVSTAMNVAALLHNEGAWRGVDLAELRSVLTSFVNDLRWLRSKTEMGLLVGITWPEDAQARIDTSAQLVDAWDPSELPSPDLLDAMQGACRLIQPRG